MDLTGLVCEASMWVKAKLKKAITAADTYFGLADAVGFEQINVGDIAVMDRVRSPEQMLVTGFDETNRLVRVQRGYNGSLVSDYRKGSGLKVFRVLNAAAATEVAKEDIPQVDGTTKKGVLTKASLVYEWQGQDTCLPGCYWFEFKLLKMLGSASSSPMFLGSGVSTPSVSFISYTPSQVACGIGAGVEWVQRYPTTGDGFLVRISDSPTAEGVF